MSDLADDRDVIETTIVDVSEDARPVVGASETEPLAGRIAVVTGGSGGVGGEIATLLADAGARVCLVGRDVAKLRQAVGRAADPSKMLYLRCDLGSNSDIEELTEFIDRFDHPVDIVIHAAHVSVAAGVERGAIADLDEQYLVNVRGPYVLSQRLAPSLQQSGGQVVFLTSTIDRPTRGDTQRAICDAAVIELANGLRAELSDDGVRVTTVHLPSEGLVGSTAERAAADVAAAVVSTVTATSHVEVSELVIRSAFR